MTLDTSANRLSNVDPWIAISVYARRPWHSTRCFRRIVTGTHVILPCAQFGTRESSGNLPRPIARFVPYPDQRIPLISADSLDLRARSKEEQVGFVDEMAVLVGDKNQRRSGDRLDA
jgi:hypothetical protein